MQLPLLTSLREVSIGPRRFLTFIGFNVVSWHSLVGPVLVLFARNINMPASWIGWLLSFMPLSMVIVPLTAGLVHRLGPRRIMLTTWMLRNFMSISIFAMPWAAARYGERGAWFVLTFATLSFCVVRATGVGGWFPWMHEFAPDHERSAYFSAETAITQLVIVCLNLGHALLLRDHPTLSRFFIIYSVGIGAGFVSLLFLARVPGGRAAPHGLPEAHASYTRVLLDRFFLWYVLIASGGFVAVTWLSASIILFMREALHLAAMQILMVMTLAGGGIFLAIRFWTAYAEASGSSKAIGLTLAGHSLVALVFLIIPTGAWFTLPVLGVAVVLTGILAAAYSVTVHRAMLGLVPNDSRVGYTNVWILGTSLALGVTPIVAGWVIERYRTAGFEACFGLCAATGVACAAAMAVLMETKTAGSARRLLHPAVPFRVVRRVLFVTVGLDRSSRRR